MTGRTAARPSHAHPAPPSWRTCGATGPRAGAGLSTPSRSRTPFSTRPRSAPGAHARGPAEGRGRVSGAVQIALTVTYRGREAHPRRPLRPRLHHEPRPRRRAPSRRASRRRRPPWAPPRRGIRRRGCERRDHLAPGLRRDDEGRASREVRTPTGVEAPPPRASARTEFDALRGNHIVVDVERLIGPANRHRRGSLVGQSKMHLRWARAVQAR